MKSKIVCFHLLNDYSGSPKVLSQVIKGFVASGKEVDLFCAGNQREGFLSNIEGVNHYKYYYQWSTYKILTLVRLFYSQFILFIRLLSYWNKNVVFYVNTILPFGALMAGKLMRKPVVCHVHETSIKPQLLKWYLFKVVELSATDVIYVSEYLKNNEPIKKTIPHVVYNSLSNDFISKAEEYLTDKRNKTILMLCSLKAYKGVFDFVKLACEMPSFKFELVVNANFDELRTFFRDVSIPPNLKIFPVQKNVHLFYSRAFVVLNLSHPDKWVETFGLTALEAMCYGVPVIVPPVGGIAEVVQDGINGYRLNVKDRSTIKSVIKHMWKKPKVYQRISENAKNRINDFMPQRMQLQIQNIVQNV
jgi:glycosyltransferase involved in cell wall biosynthesis